MKWLSVMGIVVLSFLFLSGILLAAESSGIEVPLIPSPDPAPSEKGTNYLNLILALETTWKIIGMIGTVIVGWVFKLIGSKVVKEAADKEVLDVLHESVMATYTEFVQEAKRAARDGKLTSEEIKTARTMAYNKAIASATGTAKPILVAWGKEKAMSVIELIVNKLKKKKAA